MKLQVQEMVMKQIQGMLDLSWKSACTWPKKLKWASAVPEQSLLVAERVPGEDEGGHLGRKHLREKNGEAGVVVGSVSRSCK